MAKTPEEKIAEMGLTLPEAMVVPAGYESPPLVMTKQAGNILYVSGHFPMNVDGTIATHLLGKLGAEIDVEQGQEAAKLTALAMLRTLKDELGDLGKIKSWVKVLGMVNSTPDFAQQSQIINVFSELIIDVFGKECGTAARSAVGMAVLPSNIPCEIEAILELRD